MTSELSWAQDPSQRRRSNRSAPSYNGFYLPRTRIYGLATSMVNELHYTMVTFETRLRLSCHFSSSSRDPSTNPYVGVQLCGVQYQQTRITSWAIKLCCIFSSVKIIQMINAKYWSFSQSQLLEKRDVLRQEGKRCGSGWVSNCFL